MIALWLAACGLFGAPTVQEAAPDAAVLPQSGTEEPSLPGAREGAPPVPVLSSARTTYSEPDGAGASSFADLLADEAAKAAAVGQAPFVQLYADWCGPCRELRAAMSDPRMEEAFAGTWIVLLDADHWRLPLAAAGLEGSAVSVPAFHELRPDGTFGDHINGHAWGANTAENMAPPLQAFFREHGANPGAAPP